MSDAKITGGTITLPMDDYLALVSERDALAAVAEAGDGLGQLIQTILRRYGGTMKGRGDHDIYEALLRYKAAYDRTVAKP